LKVVGSVVYVFWGFDGFLLGIRIGRKNVVIQNVFVDVYDDVSYPTALSVFSHYSIE